jgi:hypothetical protein
MYFARREVNYFPCEDGSLLPVQSFNFLSARLKGPPPIGISGGHDYLAIPRRHTAVS